MRIKKVKLTPENKIAIMYENKTRDGGFDEYSLTCSEKARPEFYAALQDLAVHVLDMCELPEDYLKRIEVRGVSFSYAGMDDVMGATISASMILDNSYQKLNLNTPHKASDSYCEGDPDPKQVLSGKCIGALEDLCEEVELYISGDRAQTQLFGAA